ncbi:MAG: hypothetical protein HKN20_06225 [Gemmatimonadetes bacterium]|nr:hypothetical protein [Gemmatimonadota bacterium]
MSFTGKRSLSGLHEAVVAAGIVAAAIAAGGILSPAFAGGFNLGAGEFGVGIGNTVRHTGIRLNAVDQDVERVNGLNFTLWRPGENPDLLVAGVGAGIVGPDGADLRGIMLGGYGVNAERVTGVALGLLAVGIDDMRGIAFAPIGAGFGGMTGLAVGGLFAGGAEMDGITIGGLGAGGVKMHGITVGGLAILADQIRGAALTLGYLKAREQRGVSIALFNRTRDLQGLQIGLLNHAGNNPAPFRWLPLLNLHID